MMGVRNESVQKAKAAPFLRCQPGSRGEKVTEGSNVIITSRKASPEGDMRCETQITMRGKEQRSCLEIKTERQKKIAGRT